MWSDLSEIPSPFFNDAAVVPQADKTVRVQALVSESTVEAFHEISAQATPSWRALLRRTSYTSQKGEIEGQGDR